MAGFVHIAITCVEYMRNNSEKFRKCRKQQNFDNFGENCCPLLDTLLSGSPILQNGKLVGAVTHVLVNEPTRGYGILAENMMAAAQ